MNPIIPRIDAKRAAFAIECRNIRLWLAANPGSTSAEIKDKVGGRWCFALQKMSGMGIVKCEKTFNPNGKPEFLWYVVPQ